MSHISDLTYNMETDSWEGLPNQTTVTDLYTLLVLDNGNRILSFANRFKAGEDVHILDATGKNLLSWSHVEWGDMPERIMGAIVRAAGGVS